MTTFAVGDKVRVNSDVHGEVMNYAGGEGVIVHIAANDNSTLYTVEGMVDFRTVFHAHELEPAPASPVPDAAALRTALAERDALTDMVQRAERECTALWSVIVFIQEHLSEPLDDESLSIARNLAGSTLDEVLAMVEDNKDEIAEQRQWIVQRATEYVAYRAQAHGSDMAALGYEEWIMERQSRTPSTAQATATPPDAESEEGN